MSETPGQYKTDQPTHTKGQSNPKPKNRNWGGKRPRSGRKPDPNTDRHSPISSTVTDSERLQIIEAAALAGYNNLSEYIRDKMLDRIKTR